MRNALLILLLCSCGVSKKAIHNRTTWISARGNIVTFDGKWLVYKERGCYITGTQKKLPNNYILWDILANTCSNIETTTSCYFAKNAYGEHGNLVCFDLTISETFYRINNDYQPK